MNYCSLYFVFSDHDETAALLEDACMPVEQVLKRLTNGEVTGPIKGRG